MSDKATSQPGEEATRAYLQYLTDPDSLRDEDHVKQLRTHAAQTEDVLERARLLAEAHRAEDIDEEPLRKGFIEHAKAWATANDVPPSVLQEMGVPEDVLSQAGFETGRRSRRGTSRGSTGVRTKRISSEQVRQHVLGRTAAFTLKDVSDGLGGSLMTIRKVVEELVEAGSVERLGPIEDYQGRGRAPVQYRTKA